MKSRSGGAFNCAGQVNEVLFTTGFGVDIVLFFGGERTQGSSSPTGNFSHLKYKKKSLKFEILEISWEKVALYPIGQFYRSAL